LTRRGHIDLHLSVTAMGTIVVAPMIVVGLIVRKWLVTGLTLGAVTGE
jgi:multiple sugar transport system permease protein